MNDEEDKAIERIDFLKEVDRSLESPRSKQAAIGQPHAEGTSSRREAIQGGKEVTTPSNDLSAFYQVTWHDLRELERLTREYHPNPMSYVETRAIYRSVGWAVGSHIQSIARGEFYSSSIFDGSVSYVSNMVDRALLLSRETER